VAVTLQTRLAAAHRLAQARLADAVARVVATSWDSNVRAPGVGTDRLVEMTVPIVKTASAQSTALARAFYQNVRSIELPGVPRASLDVAPIVDEQVITALVAGGFQRLSESLKAGHTLDEALLSGKTGAQGAAMRSLMAPGRGMIQDAHTQDQGVIGYYRVTEQGCCYFCAMLASRGAVYARQSFDQSDPRFIGPGEVKVHDSCRCAYAPFFRDAPELPDLTLELSDFWKATTGDYSGWDKAKAFRRAYEATYLRGGNLGVTEEVA
jgi:hypothetical protein